MFLILLQSALFLSVRANKALSVSSYQAMSRTYTTEMNTLAESYTGRIFQDAVNLGRFEDSDDSNEIRECKMDAMMQKKVFATAVKDYNRHYLALSLSSNVTDLSARLNKNIHKNRNEFGLGNMECLNVGNGGNCFPNDMFHNSLYQQWNASRILNRVLGRGDPAWLADMRAFADIFGMAITAGESTHFLGQPECEERWTKMVQEVKTLMDPQVTPQYGELVDYAELMASGVLLDSQELMAYKDLEANLTTNKKRKFSNAKKAVVDTLKNLEPKLHYLLKIKKTFEELNEKANIVRMTETTRKCRALINVARIPGIDPTNRNKILDELVKVSGAELLNQFEKFTTLKSLTRKLKLFNGSWEFDDKILNEIAMGCAAIDKSQIYDMDQNTQTVLESALAEKIRNTNEGCEMTTTDDMEMLKDVWSTSPCVTKYPIAIHYTVLRLAKLFSAKVPLTDVPFQSESLKCFLEKAKPIVDLIVKKLRANKYLFDLTSEDFDFVLDVLSGRLKQDSTNLSRAASLLQLMEISSTKIMLKDQKRAREDIDPLMQLLEEQLARWNGLEAAHDTALTPLTKDLARLLNKDSYVPDNLIQRFSGFPKGNYDSLIINIDKLRNGSPKRRIITLAKNTKILLKRLHNIYKFGTRDLETMQCMWNESLDKSKQMNMEGNARLCDAFWATLKWPLSEKAELEFFQIHKADVAALGQLDHFLTSDGVRDPKELRSSILSC